MDLVFAGIDGALRLLRGGFVVLAAILAVICGLDWLVRTRKINPFSPIARFMRNTVDPLLVPVERRVVRAGGLPANAPWWALVGVIVAGVLLISLLGFLRDQAMYVDGAFQRGPRAVYHLAVSWAIAVLRGALIVRVVLSWLRYRPGAWYARWSFKLTEPYLRPLRKVIPLVANVDITPIVAWFGLALLEYLLHRIG